MNTNPKHGYLTEPKWFTTRTVTREAISLGTWAEVAAVGAFLFVGWIVLS